MQRRYIMESKYYYLSPLKMLVTCLFLLTTPLYLCAEESPSTPPSVMPETESQIVKFNAKDGFELSADYYLGAEQGAGVLLLHGCDSDKSSYARLGKILADHGFHALAIDFRGFGDNASEKYSHDAVKRQSDDIVSYQANVTFLSAFWAGDSFSAHQYLETRLAEKKGISIIAVGCAVAQAISLAERIHVESLVLIAPTIGHIEKEQYRNLIDFPTYFIAPLYHNQSYQTAKELFEWNGDNQTKFQIIKGSQSDHSILRKNPEIEHGIALWIKYL